MSWFTDTDRLFETASNKALLAGMPERIFAEIQVDYRSKKIGFVEASWRLFILSKQVQLKNLGLHYGTTIRQLQAKARTPANIVPIDSLEQLLLDALTAISPSAVLQDDRGRTMSLRASAYSIFVGHAWAYGKAVYVIDADIAASIGNAETFEIPCAVLRHLPTTALCIQHQVGDIAAAFFHVMFTDDGNVVLGYMLARDLPANVEDVPFLEVNVAVSQATGHIGLGSKLVVDGVVSKSPVGVYLNLLLLLCCRNIEIIGVATQKPGPSVDSKTRKILMTPGERQWHVGVRQGAALRANAAQVQGTDEGGQQTGRSVRAHMRRAHWHHFWTGPRDAAERTLILHWVAPVLVGAVEDLVETHHKVQGA